jgi:hypothetical protein
MNCLGCGHREDDHDHLSGITMRRDCEIPNCPCRDMIYPDNNAEKDRLNPDVDMKKKLEDDFTMSHYFRFLLLAAQPPKKNVVIINLKDEHES